MKRTIWVSILLLSLVAFGGLASCKSAILQTVESVPIKMNKADYQRADIENAIIQAGAKLDWQMHKQNPGTIRGTKVLGDKMAEVDVVYNLQDFSIRYHDSRELSYQPGKIHKIYNLWVNQLKNAIQVQLLAQQ